MNRISYTALDMVSVPEDLQKVFRWAQNYVKNYFRLNQQNPEKGSIKFSVRWQKCRLYQYQHRHLVHQSH